MASPCLIFLSDGVAYDLIIREVLINFICDRIYLIATNNHLR